MSYGPIILPKASAVDLSEGALWLTRRRPAFTRGFGKAESRVGFNAKGMGSTWYNHGVGYAPFVWGHDQGEGLAPVRRGGDRNQTRIDVRTDSRRA